MPGYIYYLILAAASIALAAFVFYKHKAYSKLITFYLSSVMVAYCGEVLALILLNAYSYQLGIDIDPFAEGILAHLITNSTVWPAVAVFVAAYSRRFRWIFVISVIFILLDILFIQLGTYEHNWWQSWMSGVAIFIYCIAMRFWYSKLEDSRFKILRFITFSFACTVIMFIPSAILLLAGKEFYRIGVYTDMNKDSVFFSFLYHSIFAPLCTFLLCVLKKWYFKLIPFLLFFAGDYLLMVLGISKLTDG